MGKGKKKSKTSAASPSTGQKKPVETEVDDMLEDVIDEVEDVQLSDDDGVKSKPLTNAKKGNGRPKVSFEEQIEKENGDKQEVEEEGAKKISRKEMKRMKKKVEQLYNKYYTCRGEF